jgi:hypothetical protein
MTEIELVTERTLRMIAEQDKARAERHEKLMDAFDRLDAAFDAILGKPPVVTPPRAPEVQP